MEEAVESEVESEDAKMKRRGQARSDDGSVGLCGSHHPTPTARGPPPPPPASRYTPVATAALSTTAAAHPHEILPRLVLARSRLVTLARSSPTANRRPNTSFPPPIGSTTTTVRHIVRWPLNLEMTANSLQQRVLAWEHQVVVDGQ
ncbi:unnamed protein product [Urochloa humidicola]